MKRILLALVLIISYSFNCAAQDSDVPVSAAEKTKARQQYQLDPASALATRIAGTPESILKDFYDAGMSPKEHRLSADEQHIVAKAFAILPPLTQKVLKEHLQGISFLDDMPNTALTSTFNPGEPYRIYHITIRAAILKQTVSEWLTEKEHTCFDTSRSNLSLSVSGGRFNALVYVLMHESTHVVDGSLGMFNEIKSFPGNPWRTAAMRFANGVWVDRTTFVPAVQNSLILKNHFRRGLPIKLSQAESAYRALGTLPLVSIYSTSSWSEDLAEYVTVSYLTKHLHQPFRIIITRDGAEVYSFEPMKLKKVQSRNQVMDRFYSVKGS